MVMAVSEPMACYMRHYINYVEAGIEKILHIDIGSLATATWEIVKTKVQFSTRTVDEDRS